METMAAWYGLKESHRDFFVENDGDAGLLFARSELNTHLQAILRKSFRTRNPPKFVLYGDWGAGKTHTLRHIQYKVEQSADYGANIVYVELPDITAKSDFRVAHAAFLDALGLDQVRNWMVQFQTKRQSASHETIQQQAQSGDIANAFVSLISYGDAARICWDWLRGVALSAGDARSVGLAPVLDQSNQLTNVLRVLGRLSLDIDDKLLIFMLDEADKLEFVTNGDSIHHWLNAFKILSDTQTKEVGLIVAASFRDPDEMPSPLSEQQVRSRFGASHYIQLTNFDPEEAEEFVRGLLSEWIDLSKRAELLSKFSGETEGEDVTESSFPFTERSLKRFVDYACRNGGVTTPRDIQKALDDVLNLAIDHQRHILSLRFLEQLMAAG
jgi:Cdc6-like AAA superfamily ATPase